MSFRAHLSAAHVLKHRWCLIRTEVGRVRSGMPRRRQLSFPMLTFCRSRWRSTDDGHDQASSRSVLLAIVAVPAFGALCWLFFATKRPDADVHKDRHCSGNSGALLRVGKYWLPLEFFKQKTKLKEIKEFLVDDSDVIVASFPKSGTTWVQEIIHLMMTGPEQSDERTIEELFPYIEYVYPGLASLAKSPSPRYLKTHLPYEFLPDDVQKGHGKVIYIARNMKDVSVSYYHFIKMLTITKYRGQFSDFFQAFVDGKVAYGPWTEHVLEYWKHRGDDNVLFITYEDLHQNPFATIKEISSFLGKTLDDDHMLEIAFRCSFDEMKSNSLVNYSWWDDLGIRDKKQADFLRKGKVGDWTNYYTDDMIKRADECCMVALREEGLHLKDKTQ